MIFPRIQLFDDELLSRSRSGTIWGRIYFDLGEEFFPDQGWSDLVVVITTAWVDALTKMAEGTTETANVFFMDGPAAVHLSLLQRGLVKLEFLHKEKIKHSLDASLHALLRDAISAGQKLLGICESHGWAQDHDCTDLADSIDRGARALPV